MKYLSHWLFVIAFTMFNSAYAIGMPDLAKQRNCTACHAIDKKVVGPAWSEVAKKYKSDKEAPVFLAGKIKHGGKGSWGSMPMPPQAVSNDEAKELAKFILSL